MRLPVPRPSSGRVPPGASPFWALLAALSLLACDGGEAGRHLASVDGEQITQGDLKNYEVLRYLGDRGSGLPVEPAPKLHRLGMLLELIDQRLLLRRADSQGLVAAERDVDAAMERFRLAYGTADDFREFLGSLDVEPSDIRTELRRQLTVERLLDREVASRVRVTEREMREYYEGNLEAFSVPEQQLRLAQILVTEAPVSPIPNLRNDDATDAEAARNKIQRIREELEDGVPFDELALNYSEDPVYAANAGDMGFFPQSVIEKMDVRLRRAVIRLQPGEFSDVVETDGEYRILQLIGIEAEGQRDFEDPSVRQSIREVLANRKGSCCGWRSTRSSAAGPRSATIWPSRSRPSTGSVSDPRAA